MFAYYYGDAYEIIYLKKCNTSTMSQKVDSQSGADLKLVAISNRHPVVLGELCQCFP